MVSANNPINNKVGASISGVTNTLTVTNPSNTASSAARETITVGGGTAGDPTLNFNVSGVTNWEMGIDNSVNDNLTISQGTALGTNDVWRMTTAGERTMPLQPAFLAYVDPSVPNVTGDNTTYTVIFNNEVYDQNGDYNPATGTFTAPVTGRYQFNVTVGGNGVTIGMNLAAITLNVNAGGAIYQLYTSHAGNALNSGTGIAFSGSSTLSLSAGDTVVVQWRVMGGAKVVSVEGVSGITRICLFSGFLVC